MKLTFHGKNRTLKYILKSPIFERKVHLPNNGGRKLRAPVRLVLVKRGSSGQCVFSNISVVNSESLMKEFRIFAQKSKALQRPQSYECVTVD